MIEFTNGALTLGYVIVGFFFLRFWRKTNDSLFVTFAIAFWLFAVNQAVSYALSNRERDIQYEYILRVLGFLIIMAGIVGKNLRSRDRERRSRS